MPGMDMVLATGWTRMGMGLIGSSEIRSWSCTSWSVFIRLLDGDDFLVATMDGDGNRANATASEVVDDASGRQGSTLSSRASFSATGRLRLKVPIRDPIVGMSSRDPSVPQLQLGPPRNLYEIFGSVYCHKPLHLCWVQNCHRFVQSRQH
jgi:hypothetical protein